MKNYEYDLITFPRFGFIHVDCAGSLTNWEPIDLDKWERTVKALQERKE